MPSPGDLQRQTHSPFSITLEMLRQLPEEFNEAIRLDYELSLLEAAGKLPLITLIALRPKMQQVHQRGRLEIKRVTESLQILKGLPPEARRDRPPIGF